MEDCPLRVFDYQSSYRVRCAMDDDYAWIDLPVRLLMASLFLESGIGKLFNSAAMETYMRSFGVPGILLWPAAAWEIGSSLLLALGLGTRRIAPLLAGWCLLTATIFHTNFSDHVMVIMFFKNMVMAGGFLMLTKYGATGLSLDGWIEQKRDPDRVRDARFSGR